MAFVGKPDQNSSLSAWNGTSWVSLTGSCTITTASFVSTINLSQTGTLDWFTPNGTYTQNYRSTGGHQSKALGGTIHVSFDWLPRGGTSFTQASAYTVSTVLSDSIGNTAISSLTTDQGLFIAAGTGPGYRFRAKSDSSLRTLRIYGSTFSGASTVTVRSEDRSFPDTSYTIVTAAAASISHIFEIRYNTVFSSEISVNVELTANSGSSPNVKFMAATLR